MIIRKGATKYLKEEHWHIRGDGSWWEYDGYGIPLCRVCDGCIEQKMAGYRKDIHEHYDAEEPIDDD
jgi:hypothetical protein